MFSVVAPVVRQGSTDVSEEPNAPVFIAEEYLYKNKKKFRGPSPSLVGEVSANVCRQRVSRGQRGRFPTAVISASKTGAATISSK
jgi:hypothetical protein